MLDCTNENASLHFLSADFTLRVDKMRFWRSKMLATSTGLAGDAALSGLTSASCFNSSIFTIRYFLFLASGSSLVLLCFASNSPSKSGQASIFPGSIELLRRLL